MAVTPATTSLRVAVVHNRYQQPGGEDQVFEREAALLQDAGHEVLRYEVHNDAIDSSSAVGVAARTVWNATTYRVLRHVFADFRPDVVHVHNTLPLVSASVFAAARRAGAAVIQTLHNYRMICPSATLFRNDRPCELCVSQPLALSGIRHACYRNSRAATAVVAGTTFIHRALGTYIRNVDRFIALTDFARAKLIAGGIPPWQLVVKPNFTEPATQHRVQGGDAALFVGRLTEEKGVRTLLEAWRRHPSLLPLRIAGDGALKNMADTLAASSHHNVKVLGALPGHAIRTEMRGARLLVFPSVCYEGFPVTIAEAFSVGLPVVASRIGSIPEIVLDNAVGLTFTAGNADELAECVHRLTVDPQLNLALSRGALEQYENRYTPEANLKQLLSIYRDAMEHRPVRSSR